MKQSVAGQLPFIFGIARLGPSRMLPERLGVDQEISEMEIRVAAPCVVEAPHGPAACSGDALDRLGCRVRFEESAEVDGIFDVDRCERSTPEQSGPGADGERGRRNGGTASLQLVGDEKLSMGA